MSRPGRNDPCPCGSGKKYKQCCLANERNRAANPKPAAAGGGDREALERAMTFHRGGNLAQAFAIYQQLLQQRPRDPELLHLAGLAAYQGGNHPVALELIGRAVALRPRMAGFLSNLGQVHEALNHTDDAIACYRRALAIDPALPEANSNLGGLLAARRELDESIALCRRALTARPAFPEALCNLGLALNYSDRLDEAVDSCRKAIALWPGCAQAWHNLGNTQTRQGLLDDAIASFRQAIAIRPDYAAAFDNLCFTTLYRDGDRPDAVFALHREAAARLAPAPPAGRVVHANVRDPDRRLRIGYVSPDLRRHSVAYFIEPVFAHHDRETFEVHAYYNHTREDAVSARLRASVDHWTPCANLSDDELAARIRADGIDLLIDLAGHSANNRLAVFARKPAPVQASWLGYPATTGMEAMDWRITTAAADPEGSEVWHSEALYRLPHSLWCYRPDPEAPDHGAAARDGGAICFGSINNFPKITPAAIALWARILAAAPEARLLMTHVPDGTAREALIARFAAHGVVRERLALYGRLPDADYRARVAEIDIALDPFPYAGTTTTCESLWMGIPVVTLTGATSVARSGHALLGMIGLGELCARDEDDYAAIALALARDPARLRALRAGLRARVAASPLRDEAGFTRALEAAYREIWRRWCAAGADDPERLYALGQQHNQAGRSREAVECLRRAIAANPRHARAYNTLGMALEDLGRADEALAAYREAVRLDPRGYEARYNLGGALLNAGALDEAVAELERAAALDPARGLAQMTLGQALIRRGEVARALPLLEQALARMPGRALAHDLRLFALNYLSDDPAVLARAHRAYGERIETPLRAAWPAHANDRDPERRLRIGYVSPDFREHSVARFFEPVLARHDRARFELHAYYAAPLRDAVTARIEAAVDRFTPCDRLDDAQLAARIEDDGIDILVDLAGHTTGNRLSMFARKPAPVQVSWLGYPATTGLTAIDWRLVTADTDPPGAEAWHSEGLWRLPRTLWCWRPDPEAPAVDPRTPARRNGRVRLVSANNVAKLSDATIAAWSRLLLAVPGAVLTLTGIPAGAAEQLLRERFRAQGLDPARVEFPGRLSKAAYHALLADADLALDPFPYNGTTTSCDALWAGLPLVTLAGRVSAARSGVALLRMIGLDALVAADVEAYIGIAAALARDPDRIESLRAGMRARIAGSALCDESGLARDLEAAYRGMWRAWCAT